MIGETARGTTSPSGRERLGSRAWADESVRLIEADANRSADTHLQPFPLPGHWGIHLYLKDESVHPTRPSPITAITRERALLLVLPREPFEQLFNGEDAVSRVFLETWWQRCGRRCARGLASRPASKGGLAAVSRPRGFFRAVARRRLARW